MFLNKNRGDKPWDFNGLIKCQMAPLPSLQNGQVSKSNRTYTLREFPKRFAKDRIRLHELSPLSKIKSKSQNRERMSWTLHNFPLYCIVAYEVRIYRISRQRLHASVASLNNDWFNSNKLSNRDHGKFFFFFSLFFSHCHSFHGN